LCGDCTGEENYGGDVSRRCCNKNAPCFQGSVG
jgi:hypothetical protein